MAKDDPIDEFRRGDEPPDARIGDFLVYAGAPADRRALQAEEEDILDGSATELQQMLAEHARETGKELDFGL